MRSEDTGVRWWMTGWIKIRNILGDITMLLLYKITWFADYINGDKRS